MADQTSHEEVDINTQNIPSDDKHNGGVDKNLEGPF